MRKYILCALVSLLFALGGCSALSSALSNPGARAGAAFAVNTAALTNAVITIDPEIAQAEVALASDKSAYSSVEWQTLQTAKGQINTARDTVAAIVNSANGAQTVVSLAQLKTIYDNARAAYLNAKPIAVKHEGTLSAAQRQQLAKLDAQAKKLDADMQAVEAVNYKNVNVSQMIQTALTVAGMGAKIAIAAGA